MMKHSLPLLVAFLTSTLAGCQLYFGEEEDNGSWTYCGQDGYYECSGDDCYWRGPDCPSGSGGGGGGTMGSGGGFECTDDEDCAAGCYCGNGICEEAGFCTQDSDCGRGFVCDESRSSCVPGEQGPTNCVADNDCPQGQYCDSATLECTASCVCMTDADATSQGFDYCDESRSTCLPGVDPVGNCTGEVTCNLGRPSCPEGQVALISDGCYTGQCTAINTCSESPSCEALTHEADCQAGQNCTLSYTGINCRNPDNTPCQAGSSTTCTCDSYQFASCSSGTMPRTVVEYNGFLFDISELTLRN